MLALVRPESRGRLKMTSADPNGPPLIDPDYLSAEGDLIALSAAIDRARSVGSGTGLCEWRKREVTGIPNGRSERREFVARHVGTFWHPVGICTMGVHILYCYRSALLHRLDCSLCTS
jgi:choline dehydrogenase-like flavoprotein